jgi:hypothetical protein
MQCDNCAGEYEIASDPRHDWSPCCSHDCNGAARLREAGWTITQAFQVMRPESVARMVRNVLDAQEFDRGLKNLAKDKSETMADAVRRMIG